MVAPLALRVGKLSTRAPRYPSEPGYVQSMNEQIQQLLKIIRGTIDHIEDVTPDILKEALEPTFQKSQEYTPYRTGELRESGYLEVVQRRGQPTVEMGYGRGGHPDYTVWVHEMVEVNHQAPTRAKFLQSAIDEDMDEIWSRVQRGYTIMMGGTGRM